MLWHRLRTLFPIKKFLRTILAPTDDPCWISCFLGSCGVVIFKFHHSGNSLMVQWLELHTSVAKGVVSVTGLEPRSCQPCDAAKKINFVVLIYIYWLTFIYKEELFLISRDELLSSF